MREFVNIAVDAMGGDNAPGEIVCGAAMAAAENSNVRITLVGRQDQIREALEGLDYPKDRVSIVHAEEVIAMAEPPVNAIRTKKDSSMVVGMRMVKDGSCDAFITAGSSGACLAGGQLIVGRIRGIERSPLAPIIPGKKGPVLLIDCGANMDAKPSQLVQFAQMGSIYMKNMIGIENPRVGLVNVGTEDEKGNALCKETFPLLKECGGINFIGNIEARNIPESGCDVAVCDAFVGNAILKTYEGVASVLLSSVKDVLMSSMKTKIGALLIKDALRVKLKEFDSSNYGGAPMLGLKGLVVKTHGNSTRKEIKNAVAQCVMFTEKNLTQQFADGVDLKKRTTEPGN